MFLIVYEGYAKFLISQGYVSFWAIVYCTNHLLIIRRSCRIEQDATCIEEPSNGTIDVISIARIIHGMNLRNMCSLSRWRSSGHGGRRSDNIRI
eukprot:Gb_33077 [translate_table: standard]